MAYAGMAHGVRRDLRPYLSALYSLATQLPTSKSPLVPRWMQASSQHAHVSRLKMEKRPKHRDEPLHWFPFKKFSWKCQTTLVHDGSSISHMALFKC